MPRKMEKWMLGVIIGDVCASIYEYNNRKTDKLDEISLHDPSCHFTDDTVLTLAVAEACMEPDDTTAIGPGAQFPDYASALRKWGRMYPNAGYGGRFRGWLRLDNGEPYNSHGNGSAMRVSPVGWLYASLDDTLEQARRSAEVTHNHPEGVKGAQAVAAAIYWARNGCSKESIRERIAEDFGYALERSIADIRSEYIYDISCQGTVPEAIIAFLESRDFEHAIRLAVSIGGDSDTIAAIAGGMAEAFYGKAPENLWQFARSKLTPDMLAVVDRFETRRIEPTGPGGVCR